MREMMDSSSEETKLRAQKDPTKDNPATDLAGPGIKLRASVLQQQIGKKSHISLECSKQQSKDYI